MVELETIEGIFRNLDDYLNTLRQLAVLSEDQFVHDPIKLGAAKYYLQVAIECCMDVANHIIARQGFRAPATYSDSFTVLAEGGIIEPEFVPTAHKMVKMRNRLVHLYWEVDADILYDTLQNNLGDFDQFRAYVYHFVQT
jgi:uncharacterized protein YutE (UPF0331/DUF86 family)